MKNLVEVLLDDHQMIASRIEQLENLDFLRDLKNTGGVLDWLKHFDSLKNLIVLHHEKEDQVLYRWMIDQNKNADKNLIDVIVKEHKDINALLDRIDDCRLHNIQFLELRSLLVQLLDSYKLHMIKEEKFIYVIAQALKISNSKEKELLKNLGVIASKEVNR